MSAKVIRMHDEVDYVIACPDCGGYAMTIHVDNFNLEDAGILFIECLNRDYGKRVYVKSEAQ